MPIVNSTNSASDIPKTLAQFFQEYTFENLDAERHWELVVERTLAYGNRDELRWLFARYGRERVADWVRRMGACRLPRRQIPFWRLVLEVSALEMGPIPQGIWQY
jgi:hypothetical protein